LLNTGRAVAARRGCGERKEINLVWDRESCGAPFYGAFWGMLRERQRRLKETFSTERKGISTALSKVLAVPILRQVTQIEDAKQIRSQSI